MVTSYSFILMLHHSIKLKYAYCYKDRKIAYLCLQEAKMSQESRLKKSLLNARVNLIFYFLSLALSFFSRKIFLDALGADFMGLIGTLNNLLGFLNLAELGISTAIGYVLYKPLFEHDEKKINEIISVFGFIYRRIGFIILSAGCALACFLPLIFPNNVF